MNTNICCVCHGPATIREHTALYCAPHYIRNVMKPHTKTQTYGERIGIKK